MTKAKVYHDGAVSGARRAVDAVMTVLLAVLSLLAALVLSLFSLIRQGRGR